MMLQFFQNTKGKLFPNSQASVTPRTQAFPANEVLGRPGDVLPSITPFHRKPLQEVLHQNQKQEKRKAGGGRSSRRGGLRG